MYLPRRRFLASSLFVLGNALREALATPLWQWTDEDVLAAVKKPAPVSSKRSSTIEFGRGSTGRYYHSECLGGVDHKCSILDAKGSGLAFFDFDHDGWLDII